MRPYDKVLPVTSQSYLQCALLYTNSEGERRIRGKAVQVEHIRLTLSLTSG